MGYVVMSVYSINAAVVWWKHVSMYYDECKKKSVTSTYDK